MSEAELVDALTRSVAGELRPAAMPDEHVTRRYVGSTDCGPILALYRPEMASLAKYQNASDVWLRIVHGVTQPHSARMDRGHAWEPIGREMYRTSVGSCTDAPGLFVHPAHEWACGSPDGMVGERGIVEIKTTTIWARNRWGEPGTDKVPDGYNTQMQWLMECARRDWSHLLVAFGTDGVDDNGAPTFSVSQTAVYQMNRDAELCDALIGACERFWREHVIARVAPGIAPLHNRRAFKKLAAAK